MALFAKRAAQKASSPIDVGIGSWLGNAKSGLPFMSEVQILSLLGLQTVLRATLIISECRSSTLADGNQPPGAKFMSQRDSILRFEGFGKFGRLDLGTPGNILDWRSDWSMQYSLDPSHSEITIPNYRTWNNEIANLSGMTRIRDLLAEIIATGPDWELADGRPTDPLTTIRRDSTLSPLEYDYCDSQASTLLGAMRVPCGSDGVLQVASACGYSTGTDPEFGDPVIHLAPDGNPALGLVRLQRRLDGECELVFRSSPSVPIENQRFRRRGLRLLQNLLVDLGDGNPAWGILRDAITKIETAASDPTQWVEAWTDQTLGPQWTASPGSVVPVAVVIRSSSQPELLTRAVQAASSVALRRRTFTRGLTRRSRTEDRVLVARNAALLSKDDSYLPYVRYIATPDTGEAKVAVSESDMTMFWEVCHGDRAEAGAIMSMVLTTGLGVTDGNIVYGNELWSFIDVYCAAAVSRDPQTTFQKVGLRIPRLT